MIFNDYVTGGMPFQAWTRIGVSFETSTGKARLFINENYGDVVILHPYGEHNTNGHIRMGSTSNDVRKMRYSISAFRTVLNKEVFSIPAESRGKM